jgi:hypothetical protein
MNDVGSKGVVDLHAAKIKVFGIRTWIFHQVTLLFAFIVLAALAGILIALAIEARRFSGNLARLSSGPMSGTCRKTSSVRWPPFTAPW